METFEETFLWLQEKAIEFSSDIVIVQDALYMRAHNVKFIQGSGRKIFHK